MYIRLFKRIIDIVLSGCALIVLAPLYLILILGIKIDSGGPVLFRQKRAGIHKTYFNILKFRTMRIRRLPKVAEESSGNPPNGQDCTWRF